MNKSTPHIYLSELLDLWIDKGLKPGFIKWPCNVLFGSCLTDF